MIRRFCWFGVRNKLDPQWQRSWILQAKGMRQQRVMKPKVMYDDDDDDDVTASRSVCRPARESTIKSPSTQHTLPVMK